MENDFDICVTVIPQNISFAQSSFRANYSSKSQSLEAYLQLNALLSDVKYLIDRRAHFYLRRIFSSN